MRSRLYQGPADKPLISPRKPLEKQKVLHLASLASHDIALRLRHVEQHLRPGWQTRPYTFSVPPELEIEVLHASSPEHAENPDVLDRTLVAYCIAYNVNPANIRYIQHLLIQIFLSSKLGENPLQREETYIRRNG